MKLIHLPETEILKIARIYIRQTRVNLFLAGFSHLNPLCAWRLLCWWSCPIKKQTFITHAHAKYGYLMLIMYRQFFKSHEDFLIFNPYTLEGIFKAMNFDISAYLLFKWSMSKYVYNFLNFIAFINTASRAYLSINRNYVTKVLQILNWCT